MSQQNITTPKQYYGANKFGSAKDYGDTPLVSQWSFTVLVISASPNSFQGTGISQKATPPWEKKSGFYGEFYVEFSAKCCD